MKRYVKMLMTLVALAALLVMTAAPTVAKKPDNPGKPSGEPALYAVTMEFDGDDATNGFSTANCGGSITMELTSGGDLCAINEPAQLLDIAIKDVNWYRYYPYYPDADATFDPNDYPLADPIRGVDLTGCHGAGVDVTIEWVDGVKVLDSDPSVTQYPGLMRLIPHDGSIEFLWHSDYYREWEDVGKKKPRYIANDIEDFTYSANLAWTGSWNPDRTSTGVVSGTMNISHFSPGTYAPFNPDGFKVSFTLTITPIDG